MNNQEIDTSFLAMPKEWEKRQDHWRELTLGGVLWHQLRQLVRQETTDDATFDRLFADLESWRQFISNAEERGSLRYGKRQWEIASKLVELAKIATTQPPTGDELLDRSGFPVLSAWEWDALCTLRGEPRHVEDAVQLIALGIDAQTESGFTLQLTIACLRNGSGSVYPSPEAHAFLAVDAEFEHGINNAVAFVRRQGVALDNLDLRWRLQRHEGRPLSVLSGTSISGAFALGLAKLFAEPSDEALTALSLDGVAVTAVVGAEGTLGVVGGLWERLGKQTMDLAHRGLLHTVVVADEQSDVPEAYLREDAEPLRVIKAQMVVDATRKLSEVSQSRRMPMAGAEASGLAYQQEGSFRWRIIKEESGNIVVRLGSDRTELAGMKLTLKAGSIHKTVVCKRITEMWSEGEVTFTNNELKELPEDISLAIEGIPLN